MVIPTRSTNRRPFDDVAVGPAEHRALRQVALEESSWLQVIEDPIQRRTRQQPGRIASNSPTPDFVAELARWTSTSDPDRTVHVVGDAAYVGERVRDVDGRIS